MRQMALVMANVMRGMKGMAFQAMRMGQADEKREQELGAIRSEGEAQVKSAAMRGLRAAMVRMAKGEVAMHVEVWRTNKKWEQMQQVEALKVGADAMKAGQQVAALRHMQLIVARLMRGRQGAALQAMRSAMRDAMRDAFEIQSAESTPDRKIGTSGLGTRFSGPAAAHDKTFQ